MARFWDSYSSLCWLCIGLTEGSSLDWRLVGSPKHIERGLKGLFIANLSFMVSFAVRLFARVREYESA